MAKPTTKNGLIMLANEQFDKLWKTIGDMNEAEQNSDFCFDAEALTQKDGAAHWKRDKNLRDVLAHLYEWHQLLIEWEGANSSGVSKPFLPPPYSWKTYGEMNVEFWQKHQKLDFSLAKIEEMLTASHAKILDVIAKHSDEELFTKAYYNWTGTSSLGQYCISATSSHYDWAIKKLKAQLKALDIK